MAENSAWKWSVCVAVALTLLLSAVFLIPRSWIFLLPQNGSSSLRQDVFTPGPWLVLSPEPEIIVLPPEEPSPKPPSPIQGTPEFISADWWRKDVQVRIAASQYSKAQVDPLTATRDSLQVWREMLSLPAGSLSLTAQDSSLAARLFALRIKEGFDFEAWKPTLSALGKAEKKADIMSRAADMYGDFLQQKIMVPDKPENTEHSP